MIPTPIDGRDMAEEMLISREALRRDFIDTGFYPVFVKSALNRAPVIELVRCHECENCKHDYDGTPFCEAWNDYFTDENGYCHRGERRHRNGSNESE